MRSRAPRWLTELNENEWIPDSVRAEFGLKVRIGSEFRKRRGAGCDVWKGRVISNTAKPIRCVPGIGFAPMHDTMHECAVRVFNLLGNRVAGVEMIMPKKNNGPDKF